MYSILFKLIFVLGNFTMKRSMFLSKKYNSFLVLTVALILLLIFCFTFYGDYRQHLSSNFFEYQFSPECQCRRPSFYTSRDRKRLSSTCSDSGTFFEARQNVISFSLHFPHPVHPILRPMYMEGIHLNLANMRKYYSGFSMRIYTDEELTKESDYCKLWCDNADVFWCDVRRSPSLGNIANKFLMLWRFVTLGDPTVDILLSRDLDSVITPREVAAVKEWLNLTKPFHVMRDNPHHCITILGGMWGARNELIGKDLSVQLRETLLRTNEAYKGLDQTMLAVMIRPRLGDVVAHDSYCCLRKNLVDSRSIVRPFPTRRLNNANDFVGSSELGRGNWSLPPCPEACRPQFGKDWEYC